MNDVSRDEFEELKARVRRLEAKANDMDGSFGSDLDRFDRPVVASLDHGESYTKPQLAQKYRQLTGIRQLETAKLRAEHLVERDFFKHGYGNQYIYRG